MRLVRRITRLWPLLAVLTTAASAVTPPNPFHTFLGKLPDFTVMTDGSGWLKLQKLRDYHWSEVVPAPSPHFHHADAIVADIPDRAFVVASSDPGSCQSQLYRFRISHAGQPEATTPIPKSLTPAIIGGLAISPDGSRIAFATKPCSDNATPQASVTVLDTTTGQRRSWTLHTPSVVGSLTWGTDSQTLGYSLGQLRKATPWSLATGSVRTLNTRSATSLLDGTILYQPDPALGTLETAWFMPDLNSGGAMIDASPQLAAPSPYPDSSGHYTVTRWGTDTLWMRFTKGHPPHLLQRIKGNEVIAITTTSGQRLHQCNDAIDAFDRFLGGDFFPHGSPLACSSAS